MTAWRLGTMGFSYADWAGPFYPKGLDATRRLSYYAEHFDALELDTTFHAMPAPGVVERWRDAVPASFRFTAKVPRLVTHDSPLTAASTLDHMRRFLATMRLLGEKLGVILVQFPPFFASEHRDALRYFLHELPGDLRFAVEFRHGSWWEDAEATAEMLRKRRVAWVVADEPPKAIAMLPPDARTVVGYRPLPHVVTSDFLYVRWIGRHEQFEFLGREELDPTPRLRWWSDHLRDVLATHPSVDTVYGFFNNGYSGHSPAAARRFKRLLGMDAPEPVTAETRQGSLF